MDFHEQPGIQANRIFDFLFIMLRMTGWVGIIGMALINQVLLELAGNCPPTMWSYFQSRTLS